MRFKVCKVMVGIQFLETGTDTGSDTGTEIGTGTDTKQSIAAKCALKVEGIGYHNQ